MFALHGVIYLGDVQLNCSTYINGFIVVSFCGKEGKVNFNGLDVVKEREMANHGRILDFRYAKSI